MKTLQQIEKEIDSVIADPTNSYWLKIQLRTRLSRDCLVYRLTYNDDVAAGQLAVFQGASDEHI